MANERDDEQFGKEDQEFKPNKQQPTGQQGQQPELGQQGQSSTGQTDFGKSGDTDTLIDKPGFGQGTGSTGTGGNPASQSPGGTGGSQGGFVGSQGGASDDDLQEGATGGSDFASQGQGALDDQDEDIETGQRNTRDNDIEGGSGNI